MERRSFLLNSIMASGLVCTSQLHAIAMGADPFIPSEYAGIPPLIKAPARTEDYPRWRNELEQWRKKLKIQLKYDDSLYSESSPTHWTASAYVTHFIMMFDEKIFNRKTGTFEPDAYLDIFEKDYGKADILVLWQGYPLLGFDEKNQFDYYRYQPGGLTGLAELVKKCQARNYRVFLSYMPWDNDTNPESSDFIESLLAILKEINADGFFFDTINGFSAQQVGKLRNGLNKFRPDSSFEPEEPTPLDKISFIPMGWMYNNNYNGWTQPELPTKANLGVLRNRWFERRYLVKMCARSYEQTHILQIAWMNGTGVMVYDNLFGAGFKWKPRDRSILRAMGPALRYCKGLFQGENWYPLYEGTLIANTYANLWQNNDTMLFTFINGNNSTINGSVLKVQHKLGNRYYDIIGGTEVRSEISGGFATIYHTIPEWGIAGFVSQPAEKHTDVHFQTFLSGQKINSLKADWDYSTPKFPQQLKIPNIVKVVGNGLPNGMVRVPGAEWEMEVHYKHRECLFYQDASITTWCEQEQIPENELKSGRAAFDPSIVTFKYMNTPVRLKRKSKTGNFAIDINPVTNQSYFGFVKESGYKPNYRENYLIHWQGNNPPEKLLNHPVVYIDLEDARAYAKWLGKRLPTEEEWQQAAEGPKRLIYPWGNDMQQDACNQGGLGTTAVNAFPKGKSAYGCWDMCGNTWELTESERTDGHTRFVVLKGGSYFNAKSSVWYADGGPKPNNWAAKFILYYPGLSRCSTIGFRCAIDID